MAEITKPAGTLANGSNLASTLPPQPMQDPLIAGETLAANDACYIKASDGRVWRASGAALNEAARVFGFVYKAAQAGKPVTLLHDVVLGGYLTTEVTPGKLLYLSATVAGGLADAATTGGVKPIAIGEGYIDRYSTPTGLIRVHASWRD